MSSSETDKSRSSSPLPWREMFHSAASSPLSPFVPPVSKARRSSPAFNDVSRSQVPEIAKNPTFPSNGEIGHNHKTEVAASNHGVNKESSQSDPNSNYKQAVDPNQQQFHLAVCIAMAHAVLIFLVIVMYWIWKLLECYRKPIQWAILCSMPLRAIHGTLVKFWEASLRQGLLGTMLAIPFALCKAFIVTTLDARLALLHLIGRQQSKQGRTVKFTTLMEWLASFAILTLAFEYMGQISFAVVPFVVITFYSFGSFLGFVPEIEELEVEAKRSLLSEPSQRWNNAKTWLEWALYPVTKTYKLVESRVIDAFLNNLHHLVAVFLIVLMIVGSLSGLILFSYKIGSEGKDVVVALKTHVERSNYIEKVGVKQWMEENNIPELIDTYTGKAYDAISSQIDSFAAKYQMTELADVGKQYLIQLAHGQWRGDLMNSSSSTQLVPSHPILNKAHAITQRFKEYDMKGLYSELQQCMHLILQHLNIPREELLVRVKQIGERWLGIGKHVFANSSKLVLSVVQLFVSTANKVLSGAPELIAFCADTFIFFSVLHYLITSKSGGVMEQVLSMIPLSECTRTRCAVVLDHAVSSVLLATVKAAFFQASFTWLLFRVLKIHFLYMSTLIAFFSALLPVIPTWWSSIPATVQLVIEGQYIAAILLMAAHIGLMDYGVGVIQSHIPGHNAYLTGLSIAGGMALFGSATEGAIMGPLLMTVAISLKNLYCEFVLMTAKQG